MEEALDPSCGLISTVRVTVPRPGEAFQSRIVRQFYSEVAFDPAEFPSCRVPGDLWFTPPFLSSCFSAACVRSLVNYFFCAPPEEIVVSEASPVVFHELARRS